MKTNQFIWFVLCSIASSNPYSCFAFHSTTSPHSFHRTFAFYPQSTNFALPCQTTPQPVPLSWREANGNWFCSMDHLISQLLHSWNSSKADRKELLFRALTLFFVTRLFSRPVFHRCTLKPSSGLVTGYIWTARWSVSFHTLNPGTGALLTSTVDF